MKVAVASSSMLSGVKRCTASGTSQLRWRCLDTFQTFPPKKAGKNVLPFAGETLELSREKTVKLPNRLTDLTAFSRKIQHGASGCVSGAATLLLSAQPMGTSA